MVKNARIVAVGLICAGVLFYYSCKESHADDISDKAKASALAGVYADEAADIAQITASADEDRSRVKSTTAQINGQLTNDRDAIVATARLEAENSGLTGAELEKSVADVTKEANFELERKKITLNRDLQDALVEISTFEQQQKEATARHYAAERARMGTQ